MTYEDPNPLVSIIMGSRSDWETMKEAHDILHMMNIPHECKVVSAHRTPERMFSYAQELENSSVQIVIAGAGGAAHLPGMVASLTHRPVLGVPVESKALQGMDSLLSIAQMPGGIPVGTLAIGKAGAKNAAILAASILALNDKTIEKALIDFRKEQTEGVKLTPAD
ncbi:MAG: 5-(carboxyamino)imidazole ribonucleotide mutase [Alphaproteobacteria bacterium]|nr:5-(carboxyamino)imidazole ribonucleotide mutase [Alphaproteobacteria bacterium]